MKKVLVSLAISAMFAACSDSTTKTDVKKDSTGTATLTTVDTSKMSTMSTDTSLLHLDSNMHKMENPTHTK